MQRGFTLLESVIALAILGIALAIGIAMAGQAKRASQRVEESVTAHRQLEAVVEALRARQLALESAVVPPPLAGSPGQIRIEVTPDERYRGLYDIELHYMRVHHGVTKQTSLRTKTYRP